MAHLTLYIGNRNYSSWSLRPWLALKQAGATFDEVVIPLDRAETQETIRRVSPSGRVPALHDGDLVICDSLAICEYANELFPAAQLWPADRATRARARAVAAEMHSGFAALRTTMTMNVRRSDVKVPRGVDLQADIDRIVALWTQCRRAASGGPLLFGAFTIADAMFAPVVTRFRTYGVTLDGAAADYAEAILALPAMKEWIAAAKAEPWSIEKYDSVGR